MKKPETQKSQWLAQGHTPKKPQNWYQKPGQCHFEACALFIISWYYDFMLCLAFKEFPAGTLIKSKHLSLASKVCHNYTLVNDFLNYSRSIVLTWRVPPRNQITFIILYLSEKYDF